MKQKPGVMIYFSQVPFLQRMSAEQRGDLRVLEKQRGLEILVAVKSATQQEMSVEQGSSIAEVFEEYLGKR